MATAAEVIRFVPCRASGEGEEVSVLRDHLSDLQSRLDNVEGKLKQYETRKRFDDALTEGMIARLRGSSVNANPHLGSIVCELSARLADYWQMGWQKVDQEAMVRNFVEAGRRMIETQHEEGEHMFVDRVAFNLFAMASAQLHEHYPHEE